MLRDPDEAQRDHGRPPFFGSEYMPRVGVRLADGRVAGRDAPSFGVYDVPKDDAGIPTVPILRRMGAGGGGSHYRFRTWVFPLPPEGPLSIYVKVGKLPEGHGSIEGAPVKEAAERAHVNWS